MALVPLRDWGVYFYLFVYRMLLLPVILFLNQGGAMSVKVMAFMTRLRPRAAVIFRMRLLRLGGMPPFTGFFLKAFVLRMLVEAGMVWAGVGLVLRRAIALCYYMNVLMLTLLVGVRMGVGYREVRHPWLMVYALGVSFLGLPVAAGVFYL